MFSKTKDGTKKGTAQGTAEKPSPPSIISADLRVVGDLHSEGEIHVDGSVEGDIRSSALLVGHSAVVRGEITSSTVNVHGTVQGQIKAKTVSLAKSSHVTGDILHQDLSIEKGAFLEGHIKRMDSGKEAEGPGGKINLVVKDTAEKAADKASDTGPDKAPDKKVEVAAPGDPAVPKKVATPS